MVSSGAAELILNGHVYESRAENQIGEVACVRSDSFDAAKPFDRHAGYDRNGFLTCNYDSYHSEYGPTTQEGWKLCKHIMAVMLAKATNTPLRVVETVESDFDHMELDAFNEELFA